MNFQGVAVVPVSTGAIGSCALVGSGASHAVCSVSPGSAAQSASPTLVHVCSRTRAVRALSLDLPLPEAASVGTSSSTPRINVRQVGASGSCSILRVEAHSTESQSQRTASTTVFWNERSEQLVAHPAIQVLLHILVLCSLVIRFIDKTVYQFLNRELFFTNVNRAS